MAFQPVQMGQASPRFRQDGPVIKLEDENTSANNLYAALQSAGQVSKDAATVRATDASTEGQEIKNQGEQMKLDAANQLAQTREAEMAAIQAGQQEQAEMMKRQSFAQLAVLESLSGEYGKSMLNSELSNMPFKNLQQYIQGAIVTANPAYSAMMAKELASRENVEAMMLVQGDRLGIGKPVTDEELVQAYDTIDAIRETNPTAYAELEKTASEYLDGREKYAEAKRRGDAAIKQLELATAQQAETVRSNRVTESQNQQRISLEAERLQQTYQLQSVEMAEKAAQRVADTQHKMASLQVAAKNSEIAEMAAIRELQAAHSKSFYDAIGNLQKDVTSANEVFKTVTTAVSEAQKALAKDPNNVQAQEEYKTYMEWWRQAAARVDKSQRKVDIYRDRVSGGGGEQSRPPTVLDSFKQSMQIADANAKDHTDSGYLAAQSAMFNIIGGISSGANDGLMKIFTPDMVRQGENILQLMRQHPGRDSSEFYDGLMQQYQKSGNKIGFEILSNPETRQMVVNYVDLLSNGRSTP